MRWCAGSSLACLLIVVASACGTEATQSIGPSPVKCEVSVNGSPISIGAQGGTAGVDVTAERDCGWSVTTEAAWLTVMTPRAGQGTGRVELRATANEGPARTTSVGIAAESVRVVQANGCSYAIAPASQLLSAAAGTGSVAVTSASGCPWTATSNAEWVTVTDGGSASGNGTVSFRVDANIGPERTALITIATHVFMVVQESGCTYAIAPTFAVVGLSGAEGTIAVSTAPGCTWKAESLESWIAIVAGAIGSGSDLVQYRADPLAGPPSGSRVGTLVVAGQPFMVTQHRVAVPR